jgi:hypothetical protein
VLLYCGVCTGLRRLPPGENPIAVRNNNNNNNNNNSKRLHKEELNDMYSSPNIIRAMKSRRMRWAGNIARMGEERSAYRILIGRPEGGRSLGRPRPTWGNNIKMDLQGACWGHGVD